MNQVVGDNKLFDGSFEILSTIGRGRNTIIYRARPVQSGFVNTPFSEKEVAIKLFTSETRGLPARESRLERETQAIAAIRHKNIIKFYDCINQQDLYYIVMEYAAYGDLRSALNKRYNPFNVTQSLSYIVQLLEGLDAIHRAGIIHRDIKPENLLLKTYGTLKIADFDLALLPQERNDISGTNLGIGTLDYIAPECLDGKINDQCSDTYAVGVTLYMLLTKHSPFEGTTFTEIVKQKINGERIPLVNFIEKPPSFLEKLLDTALAANPSDRFTSALKFKENIESYLQELSLDTTVSIPPTEQLPTSLSKF